jgi:acetylornithine deacetylase/succinyl-diaminopimelate desuccinylase-like protein
MDPLTLTRELVAIDSINPSLVPGAAGEGAVADWLAGYLRRAGFDVELQDVAPGRPNVVAVADGSTPGPTRLLCGHTDTVGVDGMRAPFLPEVRDGRLYGRGTQDMKGGLAAMIAAAERWVRGARLGAGRVILAAVADEEYASLGAEALARRWRADEAVIPEPTGMAVAITHKGFSCVNIITHGRAAHGSRPADGIDAVILMGRVLARLESLDRDLQSRPPHPRLGTGSLHAGRIVGGTELSVYPARCSLQVERRTLPGEALDVAMTEVGAILDQLGRADRNFRADVTLLLARPAYGIRADHPLPTKLRRLAAECGRDAPITGMSFWTDAALLGAAGIPTVLFGPGGAGLHGLDEHVVIADLDRCAEIFERWLNAGI